MCRLAVHVSRLTGLRELDVSDNGLGVLPDGVFDLPELERLDVSGELPTRVRHHFCSGSLFWFLC